MLEILNVLWTLRENSTPILAASTTTRLQRNMALVSLSRYVSRKAYDVPSHGPNTPLASPCCIDPGRNDTRSHVRQHAGGVWRKEDNAELPNAKDRL